MTKSRVSIVDSGFSLAVTSGPAAWVGERSPRHRWHENTLTWVGREGEESVWRKVRQIEQGKLDIEGSASPDLDEKWIEEELGIRILLPKFSDPVIDQLARTFPGLRPMSDGGLFDGIVTAIIGQSISVAAAAVTQMKLCALYGGALELDGRTFAPLPTAEQLADSPADLVRRSGVTGMRAKAIVEISRRHVDGQLPTDEWARAYPDETVISLLDLPGVGRWTAESAVLWGLGAANAHPTNDVALLRAARKAFNQPEMTLRDLDHLAENWRPARGLAARLLWTDLLGPAPTT